MRRARVRLRADAGYVAGQLAHAAFAEGVEYAIGAQRIAAVWRVLNGIAATACADAIDMDSAQAAADYPRYRFRSS